MRPSLSHVEPATARLQHHVNGASLRWHYPGQVLRVVTTVTASRGHSQHRTPLALWLNIADPPDICKRACQPGPALMTIGPQRQAQKGMWSVLGSPRPTQAWIERVADPVPQQVEGQDRDGNGEPWEEHQPPV